MADNSVYRVALDIRADGTSAVRGVRNVTTEVEKSAGASKKAGKAHATAMEEATVATHKFKSALGELAGVAGLAGLGFGIERIIEAGQDWQRQQSRLEQSAESVHLSVGKTVEALNKSADETSQAGGFAAPAQAGALAQFLRLTGSTTKAIQDNAAAQNFARGANISYQQAQLLVGQALTGNVGRLQRYIGLIQPVKTAEEQLSQQHKINVNALEAQAKALGKAGPQWLKQQLLLAGVTQKQLQHAQLLDKQATATKALSQLQDKYGGSLEKFSKTTAGAISNAENVLNLALEKLGAQLLPVVAKVATTIASAVKYLSEHKDVFKFIGIAFGVFLGSLVFTKAIEGLEALGGAVVAFSGAEEEATLAAVAWGAALRATIIGIVITAIYLLITHWKQIKPVVEDVWHGIQTVIHDVTRWFANTWQDILKWFSTAWQDTSKFVTKIWDTVVNGVVTGFNTVIDAINKVIKLYNSVVGSIPFIGGSLKIGTIGHIGYVGQNNPDQKKGQRNVTGIGAGRQNSVPATGTKGAGSGNNSSAFAVTVVTALNGRPIAEETAHFVRKVNALAGAPAAAVAGF